MKRILELTFTEAKDYFLKEESYFNFDLPSYFVFNDLIQAISLHLRGQNLSCLYSTYFNTAGQIKKHQPNEFEDVNYKFLNNKDGRFAWRPFQLIHPVLYVSLVQTITEEVHWNSIVSRFTEFHQNGKIRCYSIPLQSSTNQSDKAAAVSQWWHTIEQQSIELALKYEYVLHTDISDCYGSIYTHSVPWAIHTKPVAKARRNDPSLVGNLIDKSLQSMCFGQTNGIPQGSVLMDFIAELILGYADLELSNKIQEANIQDYEIIRYRDDYRIFSNNPQDAEFITKFLTEILIELGMRLNAQKTMVSNCLIRDAMKPDKLYLLAAKKGAKSLQSHLLLIHTLSESHPNSGSLTKALTNFYKRIKKISELKENNDVLTSILVDIMYKNPKTYPIASAILSKLLSLLKEKNKTENILQLIQKKFEKIPNTGHLKIWLQRVTIKLDRTRIYSECLCEKVNNSALKVWNSDWLNPAFQDIITMTPIVNEQIIEDIDVVISNKEVELFKDDYEESQE